MKHSWHHTHRLTLALLFLVIGLAHLTHNLVWATTDHQIWGNSGVNEFRAECPKGSYLVRLQGKAGEWVDRIATLCAPWLHASQTFGPASVGPSFGDSRGGNVTFGNCGGGNIQSRAIHSCSGVPRDQICPVGEVAVGIRGRAEFFLDAVGLIRGPFPPPKPPTAATKVNLLAVTPVPDDMFVIIKPTENDRVVQGQLVLLVKPPKTGTPPVTALEFTWIDAPPGQPPSYTIAVETPKLIQNFLVPPQRTPRNAGRWEVRARTAAQPTPGSRSLPARFQVIAVQPFQSQRQSSPVQQTSPLSSSSVTQPSVIPQTAPLPSSSVTQAPAPSSAATQMRRSPFMIMPRGVEEKGGASGNDTVDTSAEPEKKP